MSDLDRLEAASDTSDGMEHPVDGDRRPRRRMRRRTRWVLVAAVLLLVVPLAAVTGYGVYLARVVSSNVQKADLLPSAGGSGQPGAVAGSGEPGAVAVPGTGLNYLLVGSDAGPDRVGGRSDVMMLVHIPQDRSNATFVHFPRDLYVDIPGHGKDKLNAAFAYGGTPLLVQTLQQLTGAHVDHVALVGFEGFKAMTDAVGGVDVFVRESSDEYGVDFVAGTTTHMDGDTALKFVRERHQLSQGDISRGQRQQEFLKALMLKALSADTLANPAQLASFIDAASRNLTVDQGLDLGEAQQLAVSMRGVRGSDIRMITAPYTGFGTSPTGASIDLVDSAKMAQLGHAIATDDLASYNG